MLLAYGDSEAATRNDPRTAHSREYMARYHREEDGRGHYTDFDLTGPGTTTGESGQAWRGDDPTLRGRCWSVPRTGGYAGWIDANVVPGYKAIKGVHARLEALAASDLLHWPKRGSGFPRLERYAEAVPGRCLNDVFEDIPPVNAQAQERTGYPTQEPLALLDRIIKASSNEGDVVLDPFCGCATACVSAESLGRQWIGIDLSPVAATLVESRLHDQLRPKGTGAAPRNRPNDTRERPCGRADPARVGVYANMPICQTPTWKSRIGPAPAPTAARGRTCWSG